MNTQNKKRRPPKKKSIFLCSDSDFWKNLCFIDKMDIWDGLQIDQITMNSQALI